MVRYRVYGVLVVLMMLTISMSGYAQVQEENLVGLWHFDNEKEETGNWGDIVFEGATTENGQLVLDNNKWAHAFEYSGPDITELTLVVWVSLDNLDVRNGSALTLDRCCNVDQFCGIVYAERQQRQWMPGSSHFRRTHDFPDVVNEDKTGEMVRVVITYKDIGNKYEFTGYRNDSNLGSRQSNHQGNNMDLRTWKKDEAEAIWGTRHSVGADDKGTRNFLVAHLEEARIYNVALTEDEVKKLQIGDGLAVEARRKLTTRWAKIKRQ